MMRRTAESLIGALVFIGLLIGTAACFLRVHKPSAHVVTERLEARVGHSSVRDSLSPAAIETQLAQITDVGSRSPGQSGLAACAELIRRVYAQAGLEIFEQDVAFASVLTDGGAGVLRFADADIELAVHPLTPNYVQPVATPSAGVVGELFEVSSPSMEAAASFDGKIAVVDLGRPEAREVGIDPAVFAELGFEAVVYTHSGGMASLSTADLIRLRFERLPANVIRVVAEPEILGFTGQRATLIAQSRWHDVRTRTIIGVLRAPEATDSALVIPVYYDAFSWIPDLAPGVYQALQTAIQLQLVEGLRIHRHELKRDIVFVAATGGNQAQIGMARLVSTVGREGASSVAGDRIAGLLAEERQAWRELDEIVSSFEDPTFATRMGREGSRLVLSRFAPGTRKRFAGQFNMLMRMRVFAFAETLLQADIAFKRNPEAIDSPEFAAFRKAKRQYDDYNSLSALSFPRFLERPESEAGGFVCDPDTLAFDPEAGRTLRRALHARFRMLKAHHADQIASLERDARLQSLFSGYRDLIVVAPAFNPDITATEQETLGFTSGTHIPHGPAAQAFHRLLEATSHRLDHTASVSIRAPRRLHSFGSELSHEGARLAATPWAALSHPAFSVITPSVSYADVADRPFHVTPNLNAMEKALAVFGEAVLACATGYGVFQRLPIDLPYAYAGNVYAAGVGTSIVPNFPVARALVTSRGKPALFTDPYGAFRVDLLTHPQNVWVRQWPLEAYYFDKDGTITHVKDSGSAAQLIYRSSQTLYDTPNNLILYRGSPVAVFDVVNPQSMKAFTGATFISRKGLGGFASTSPFSDAAGLMDFVPPDERFFVTLRAGSPDNELVSVVRAFCLGTTMTNRVAYTPDPDAEIDGPGYLAFDTPVLRNIALEASASMAALAEKRLHLQRRHGMADEMTLSFQDRAVEMLSTSTAKPTELQRRRGFRESLAYLILNHPVIHGSIAEAIWGILWYMALIVPFMFFFEKLVFGFTDIRSQLLAQGGIFLVVFVLLRMLHPAFQIVRSSLMILLGFVIILIAGSATILLSAKFQENIDALRKAQGSVRNAEGNRFGMLSTAFMLGLNNMHRRKVRTGLTCATLVLMTFVMICFSSIQSNVVNRNRAVGRAHYQGLLVRSERFAPITESEIQALRSRYGHAYTVAVRRIMPGTYDPGSRQTTAAALRVTAGEGESVVTRVAKAVLLFDAAEPLQMAIPMLTTNGWFTAAQQDGEGRAAMPVILSDSMAGRLGVSIDAVNAGRPAVSIDGRSFFVHGVFDSHAFGRIRDVDEENMLPFDIEAIVSPRIQGWNVVLADPSDPRVAAEDVLLVLNGHLEPTDPTGIRTVSAVVDMRSADYPTARRDIDAYLEQTSRQTSYGLDGVSYLSRRARVRSVAGLVDLIIPLIIAGLTVLNTMKGSVYERRNEIFVYNAVGIAPRHVFFMFVAESLVYAVVGVVLGYVLAQGTGRVLTALDLTGGLNMNFTSLSTVYASLAIAGATMLSTWFPARSAMEIAKPADDSGWHLPHPDGDSFCFDLPFTFGKRDRIAVLGFFHTYFINHGEGSSGPFFAGKPELRVRFPSSADGDTDVIPMVIVTLWCKPFDLGVSQRIHIALETDPETGEYISRMTMRRLTGTHDAWQRLNGPLVARIRRHFLHWRAASEDMKAEFFVKARALIEDGLTRNMEDEANG